MGFEVFDLTAEIYDYQAQAPKKLLDMISLKVHPGEITAIIGEIGSGKSTFVQHLNGLKAATAGKILIQNQSYPQQSRKWLQKVGIVQQFSQRQLFLSTVAAEIRYAADNFQLTADINQLCELVGLDSKLLEVHPRMLSGGEMRKVAIASVLSAQPEILVLDEPFVGLDWQGQSELMTVLNKLAQQKMTIVVVTHDLNYVYEHCQKVVVFSKGKIISENSPKAFFHDQTTLKKLGIEPPTLLQTDFVHLDQTAVKDWLTQKEDFDATN